MRKKTEPTQAQTPPELATTLYRKAQQPGATKADITAAIDAIEADKDFDLARITDVMSLAADDLIEQMTPRDAFSQEAVQRRYANLAQQLSQPNDGQLERMLIEQVVLCWLRMGVAEKKYTEVTMGGSSINVAEYWEKRLTATQKRHVRACESLARVRKLTRPAGPKLNIGTINALLKSGNHVGDLPGCGTAIRRSLRSGK